MDKAEFRKKLNALVTKALDEQFDDEEDNSFSDFWEAVRDKVDSAADDEDIDDADPEDSDELSELDVE